MDARPVVARGIVICLAIFGNGVLDGKPEQCMHAASEILCFLFIPPCDVLMSRKPENSDPKELIRV